MVTTGGGGKTWRSASSIVATDEIGYHLLKIDGYSRTKSLPFGQCIKSRPFTVGSHRWRLCYYPSGQGPQCYMDHVCICLALDEDVATAVNAKFRICLADVAAEKQPKSSLAAWPAVQFSTRGFQSQSSYTGFRVSWQAIQKSGHLRNDSFTVRCDIVVVDNYRTEEDATTFSPSVPPCDLRQHLGDLLRSEKGADVVFEVAGETIAAHRCVLAARSSVFCAELFGPMKEGSSAAEVVVSIEDMDADVFKELLCFAYTGSLPPATTQNVNGEEDYIKLQHLLVAADRYDMERLKTMCEEKLCQNIDVATVATVLALSEQHRCDSLKKACFQFLGSQPNMRAAMATDGFQHLRRSCPSLVQELIDMSLASKLSNAPMF